MEFHLSEYNLESRIITPTEFQIQKLKLHNLIYSHHRSINKTGNVRIT
jgi:hypothetical protein